MKILINPANFYSADSGAVAAREAARIFTKMGHYVAVFTHDFPADNKYPYKHYTRLKYKGTANFFTNKYNNYLRNAILDFKPNLVFFIGDIVYTPFTYLDLCYEKKIKIAFLSLAQGFYCTRLHAALGESSCTKCLTGSNFNALLNGCLEKGRNPILYFINYQLNQNFFKKRLKKVDFVLGSSQEQLEFYRLFGIPDKQIQYLPLFFDRKRIKTRKSAPENYFVILAQNRIEKGIHLISKILNSLPLEIKIKMLFYNKEESDKFLKKYPENLKFIKTGQLEILPDITMTNGAVEIISKARGVINTSIWATTTEFVLLETLGMGKPLIAFNVGIHKEIIINYHNGILINAGDFAQLGKELLKLIQNEVLYKKLSVNAKVLFNKLTDDNIYIEILNKLLDE